MHGKIFEPSQSKIGGLDAKYMILIAYFGSFILGLIPGIQYVAWLIPLIIYFVDKDNKFIAFHAMQAFLLEIVVFIFTIILAIVTAVSIGTAAIGLAAGNAVGYFGGMGAVAVFGVIFAIVAILVLIFSIIAAVHGYKYEIYEIKIVGPQASKIVFKQQ